MAKNNKTHGIFLGTIFVSNPVAQVHVTVGATDPAHALELLDRFAKFAGYPVIDIRIDQGLLVTADTLDMWEEQRNQKSECDE